MTSADLNETTDFNHSAFILLILKILLPDLIVLTC